MKNIYHVLNETAVAALKARCRKEKTSINAALNAAMLLAAQILANKTIDTTLHTPINLRSFCSPPIPKEYFGCYISVVTTTHHVEKSSNFWRLAKEYDHQLKNDVLPSDAAFFPNVFSNTDVQQEINVLCEAGRTTYPMGFTVTNLGALPFPKKYDKLEWNKLFFCTSRLAGDFVMLLNANTLHNRLMLCFTYTAPLMSHKTALKFKDDFLISLHRALM